MNLRLFERIQDIEVKRKKEQKQEVKKSKQKTKGENKNQLVQVTAGKKLRGPISLVDEERAIHEAYQVLLTEHHKRKAKRRRRAIQNLKKAEKIEEGQEVIQDAFSHIRRKSSATPFLSK